MAHTAHRQRGDNVRRLLRAVPAAVIVLAVACTTSPGEPATAPETALQDTAPETALQDTAPETAVEPAGALPVWDGPRRLTTGDVPHIQIDPVVAPEVDADLRRRAFSLPGIENRESTVSLPGARSLWLADDVELARPEVLLAGREFGHIHPDGSLHLLLPVQRALEVEDTKWGEVHPWADREGFWDGLVMVFTPESIDDVDVTMRLIVDAYNFVTGSDLEAADFP